MSRSSRFFANFQFNYNNQSYNSESVFGAGDLNDSFEYKSEIDKLDSQR